MYSRQGSCYLFVYFINFLLLMLFFSVSHCQVTVRYNPGCNISAACLNTHLVVNLIYARSPVDDGCLHYLFSTIGPSPPTLLFLKSDRNSSRVVIDWNNLLSMPLNTSAIEGSVRIEDDHEEPISHTPVGAIYTIDQLIEYNDLSNTANISNSKNVNITQIPLSDVTWNVSTSFNTAHFKGISQKHPQSFHNGSLLEIKFTFYNVSGRDPLPPRIAFNDRSVKMEFIVNNLAVNATTSRFALLVMVSNPENATYIGRKSVFPEGTVVKSTLTSIDDEYAPSIFTTTKLRWKGVLPNSTAVNSDPQTNFWNWRTVCYTQEVPTRKFSTDVKSSPLYLVNQTEISSLSTNRLLLSYYGHSIAARMTFLRSLILFGKEDDGYFAATNYLSWSSLVGFSSAPVDSFSKLVIIILFVGVCLPLVVLLGGAIFLLFRRYRGGSHYQILKSDYEPIG